MNQNYDKYIAQKYIVAIAFAIIRSKPLGKPLEEYMNEVRNKFYHREDLFQDVSISDSDFVNCDDEINDVNNVFEIGTLTIVSETNGSESVFNDIINNLDRDDQNNTNRINKSPKPVDDVTSYAVESTSMLKDQQQDNMKGNSCQQLAKSTSIKEVLDIFKDIDKINENKVFISTSTPKNGQTQITSGSNSQIYVNNNDNITFCSFEDKDENDKIDTQDTELYTVHGYTDNFTHLSQSQDINIVVPKKLIHNRNGSNNTNGSKINEKFEYVSNKDKNSDNVYSNRINISRTNDTSYNSNINVEEYNIMKVGDLDNSFYTKRGIDDKSKKIKLSNSVTKSSDEYSYLFTDIFIGANNKKYEGSPIAAENLTGIYNNTTFSSTSLLNELELDTNSLIGCNKPREHSPEHQNDNSARVINIENNFNLSDNHFILSTDSETQYYAKNNTNGNDLNAKNGPAVDKNTCKCGQLSLGYETQCASRNLVLDSPNEIEERSDAEAPEEIVTFKILEELNRVKNYLNRHDRFSDSGRSSQGSQLSGVRINESGFCLLNYLVEYPLIERASDITEEVSRMVFSVRSARVSGAIRRLMRARHFQWYSAYPFGSHCLAACDSAGLQHLKESNQLLERIIALKVLGEFVDKLHDDETYPQFVQKILEKAQELIKVIYEEDRSEDLLKKEDQINRLLLLNRSFNVTKFTIEKIQPILQEVHLKLQNKDLLELCLVKSENLCYVFHTLEVLLKRYNAAASSQASTQISQDDEKSFKRSTITEIWRKKWNLSKSDVSEGSFKKRCVLTQTSEVLNKIIVEGMDGYSLISFAALQCFNLLQP